MKKAIKFIFGIIITIVIIGYLFGGGIEKQAQNEINKIEHQVALDAEKQYSIAKRNGTDMDAYVQASLVAAAYLQANDEVNYKKWKEVETQLAKKIGLQ
jgi:hypothetical protein